MEQIFVKPAEGRRLRNEVSLVVPAEGAFVNHTTYMRRRIKNGDAVKCNPPKKKKVKEPELAE